ncbi:MAG: hypothetical protein NTZ10_00880 [Candidatus Saganbacteria bacterium]|nr:hypothetical protein [Candidatus Saganbacteria bacterium]
MINRIIRGYKPVIITTPSDFTCKPEAARTIERAVSREFGLHIPVNQVVEEFEARVKGAKIIQIAQTVDRRIYRDGITLDGNTFYIENGRIALAFMEQIFSRKEAWGKAKKVLMQDLISLGYRIGLLAPDPKIYEYFGSNVINEAKDIGIREQDIVHISDQRKPMLKIKFLRDNFVQIADTLYVTPKFRRNDLSGLLNWAKGLKIQPAELGHQGVTTIGDKFAFICEPWMPPEEKNAPVSRSVIGQYVRSISSKLSALGIKPFVVPSGFMDAFPPEILDKIGTKRRFLIPSDHSDFNILYLPVENAVFFMEPYYEANKRFLDQIVKQINPSKFGLLPDEDSLPANSLPLPGGGVYVDSAAKRTIEVLRNAGIRVEVSSIPFGMFGLGIHGGIHCSTNEIWLPPQ